MYFLRFESTITKNDPHCSHVGTERTAFTKNGAKLMWTSNFQADFETLKSRLSIQVILTY